MITVLGTRDILPVRQELAFAQTASRPGRISLGGLPIV